MWVAQHWRFIASAQAPDQRAWAPWASACPRRWARNCAGQHGAGAQVICVSGDGSIMMNIQELATLFRYGLPVKIVLLDNQALGMVRQWQELFFDEALFRNRPVGQPGLRRTGAGLPHSGRDHHPPRRGRRRFAQPDRRTRRLPAARQAIDAKANVWPLVPPGKSNAQMIEAQAT
jgi:acetolactate synthase-1/2/3 large subunit